MIFEIEHALDTFKAALVLGGFVFVVVVFMRFFLERRKK